MNLTILQQADEELYEAAKYYEDQQAGLGYKFLDEVENTLNGLNPIQKLLVNVKVITEEST